MASCYTGPSAGYRNQVATSLPSANLSQGHYRYTGDLLRLSAAINPSPHLTWPVYKSPINIDGLVPFLTRHPDKSFAIYIQTGLTSGFRIGYSNGRSQLRSRQSNHPSALANESVIDERIATELAAGRLLVPIPEQLQLSIHTSPLGLVPKAHQVNAWRMICDLSSPIGASVNDEILPELCSLQYATVDDAVGIIHQLGRGTQLVKLDIKDAYRIVPVHPADYHLLGIRWKGHTC